MPGQATGGTRRHFLTVAIFRSWRDSKGFAAPDLPGQTASIPEGGGHVKLQLFRFDDGEEYVNQFGVEEDARVVTKVFDDLLARKFFAVGTVAA